MAVRLLVAHLHRPSATLVGLALAAALIAPACSSDTTDDTPGHTNTPAPNDGSSGETPSTPAADAGSDGAAQAPIEIVPQADPTAPFGSGTRLRVRVDTDGPRRVFKSFVDPELGPCMPQPDANGTLRCLPTATFVIAQAVFIDAACTDELWFEGFSNCNSPAAAAFVTLDAGTCPGCKTVRERTAVVSGGAGGTLYERAAGGACVRASYPAGGGELLRLGATVAMDRFVSFERAQFGEGRVRSGGLRGSDGSYLEDGLLFDETEQYACSMQHDRAGTARCLPAVPTSNFFSDATCTVGVTSLNGPEPVPAAGTYLSLGDACTPPRIAMHVPGAAYTGTMHFRGAEACIAQGPAGPNVITLGAEIDPARYETMSDDVDGTGRLQRRVWRAGTEARSAGTSNLLHDSVLQTDCSPALAADGQLRCLPTQWQYDRQFSDAACTQRVFPPSQCGDLPYARYAFEANSASCELRRLHVARLGPSVDLAESYALDASEQCVPVSGGRLQPILSEVAPSELQPMVDVVVE